MTTQKVPQVALYKIQLMDGTEETVQGQAYQVMADGSLAFGMIVIDAQNHPQIDITTVYASRAWKKVHKSPIQAPTGGLTQ